MISYIPIFLNIIFLSLSTYIAYGHLQVQFLQSFDDSASFGCRRCELSDFQKFGSMRSLSFVVLIFFRLNSSHIKAAPFFLFFRIYAMLQKCDVEFILHFLIRIRFLLPREFRCFILYSQAINLSIDCSTKSEITSMKKTFLSISYYIHYYNFLLYSFLQIYLY
jgi:hypothetical protein